MSNHDEPARVIPAAYTAADSNRSDTIQSNTHETEEQKNSSVLGGIDPAVFDTLRNFEFLPFPVDSVADEPAVDVDAWFEDYSDQAVHEHLAKNEGHVLDFIVPPDLIALRAPNPTVKTAMWLLLEEAGLPPFLCFRSGDEWITIFQWSREGRIKDELTVRVKADQIDILYPGYTLRATPQMVVDACHAKSIANLHEIDATSLALFLKYNRKVVTDALAKEEDAASHPLKPYSLRGQSEKLGKEMIAAVEVLPGLALRGQSTMIFAPPNTGKTLLILFLIIQAIRSGLLQPSHLFYVNVDDNTSGLYDKLLLAEKHGFHMLAEGYQGYRAGDFLAQVQTLIRDGHASTTVIILDTLKRFTDVMDKRTNSEFTGVMRRLVLKGGTVIALGHTNKKRNANGKSMFAGTSDLLDDVDCAYIIDEVDGDRAEQRKIVEFKREKGRGQVVEKAAFSYSVADGQSYAELLASVEEVDPATLESIQHAAAMVSEQPVIDAIEQSIQAGQNAKMQLITGVARQVKVGQRTVGSILERYTGEDPAQHRWTYHVGERGAKLYVLIAFDRSTPADQ